MGSSGQFAPGHQKVGGRQKGVPNKATRAWKEFVTGLCDDVKVQNSARRAILKGKTELLFRAAEHAHGRPHQSVDIQGEMKMIQWPTRVATLADVTGDSGDDEQRD